MNARPRTGLLAASGIVLVMLTTACGGTQEKPAANTGAVAPGGQAGGAQPEQLQQRQTQPLPGDAGVPPGDAGVPPGDAGVPPGDPSAAAPGGTGGVGAAPGDAGAGVGAGLTLRASRSRKLGSIVTDTDGFTLYRFDKDKASPSVSNCNGTCATKWPPVLATGEVKVEGGTVGPIGTVRRADGAEQVTVNGWPVYRFAKDKAPGDVKGQGVSKTWFAVTPDGKKAKAPAGRPTRSPQPAQPGEPGVPAEPVQPGLPAVPPEPGAPAQPAGFFGDY